MMRRYLLLVADGRLAADAASGLAARTGLSVALASERMAVLVSPNCRCFSLPSGGAIVGTLFPRHGPARPLEALDPAHEKVIEETGASGLLRSVWGGYIARLPLGGDFQLLRDPSGALPCYCAKHGPLVGFASDAALLIEAGLARAGMDWDVLGRHFLTAGVPVPPTPVPGIFELLPGMAVDPARPLDAQHPVWSPWDHVQPRPPEEGRERVARAVRQAVGGWSAGERLLLSVSGGLDSSIVAACLADVGAEATCLTLFGADPTGDERIYARRLCADLRLPLLEQPDRIGDIDLSRAVAAHLPRPFGRSQALSYEAAHLRAAETLGATAFMTGNGGDSVFAHSQSAGAIADRLLAHGPGLGVLRSVGDVCRQTGCSAARALWSALRLLRSPPGYRPRPDPLFLAAELAAAGAAAPPDHPWLRAPKGALPGKAAHIASVLRVLHCMEPGRSTVLPVLNPLMAQPVLEACLAIPSWEWRKGGRDRAVARDAFSGVVPETILRRRTKGGPDAFAGEILDRLRPQIRERLLDGRLVRHGIVDRAAVARALIEGRVTLLEERVRLLELVNVEAWLEKWVGAARALGG
jgi:asparagine synthase (glutamine-hydrolysing)